MAAARTPAKGCKLCEGNVSSYRCSGGHLVHNDRHFALLHLRDGSVLADVLEQLLCLLGSCRQLYILDRQLTLQSNLTTPSEINNADAHPKLPYEAVMSLRCNAAHADMQGPCQRQSRAPTFMRLTSTLASFIFCSPTLMELASSLVSASFSLYSLR